MLITDIELDPCCLLEVGLWVMVGSNMRYLKVIEKLTKDSPLLNRGRISLWNLIGIITQEYLT